MKCTHCGADIADGLTVCKHCWKPVANPAAAHHEVEPQGAPSAHGPLFGVPYREVPVEMATPAQPPARRPVYYDPAPPARPGPSVRAVLTFAMGMVSALAVCMFVFSAPLDVAAIVCAGLELRAIKQGRSDAAGRWLAATGGALALSVLLLKLFVISRIFS